MSVNESVLGREADKEMAINIEYKNMFREYDIRGKVSDNELCEANIYRIVRAYAKFLHKRNIDSAIVGYDNRKCSPGFADAAIKALLDLGINVKFVGLSISPSVYFAQYLLKCEGAVMITASHNPDGWSGFKLGKGYSKTLGPEDIKEIYQSTLEDNGEKLAVQGTYEEVDVRQQYVDEVVSRIKMGENKPKIVIDAGNGGAGLFAYEIFQKLGCITFQLNCDPDIEYPHYFPNPSNLKAREKLREMVLHKYIKADIGIGFDGDGDRIGVIDENGKDIWSDMVLAILAKQLLEKKPGSKVVFDVKCSKALEEVITKNNGNAIMWKTGHSYIKSKLHEENAELGGERSGHIFVGGDDYYGYDDAVFVAAKLVEYLSNNYKTVSDIINEFPKYVTSPEIKTHCADEIKYKIVELLVNEFKERYPNKVIDINGARVQFDGGWGLVRASSNLPEIVMIFEAETREKLLEIRNIFREIMLKHKEISADWENDIE